VCYIHTSCNVLVWRPWFVKTQTKAFVCVFTNEFSIQSFILCIWLRLYLFFCVLTNEIRYAELYPSNFDMYFVIKNYDSFVRTQTMAGIRLWGHKRRRKPRRKDTNDGDGDGWSGKEVGELKKFSLALSILYFTRVANAKPCPHPLQIGAGCYTKCCQITS